MGNEYKLARVDKKINLAIKDNKMKKFKILLLAATTFLVSSLSNAALVNYQLTGQIYKIDGVDLLDLDYSQIAISFNYDDEATRTKTNGSNLDAFTAASDIIFSSIGPGGLFQFSNPADNNINWQIAELDSHDRYWIKLTAPSQPGLETIELEYFGGFGSTGSSASSSVNVFDPIGAPSTAQSFSAFVDGSDIDTICGDNFECRMSVGNATYHFMSSNLQITPVASEVPVPAAAWLLGSALAGLSVVRRRR